MWLCTGVSQQPASTLAPAHPLPSSTSTQGGRGPSRPGPSAWGGAAPTTTALPSLLLQYLSEHWPPPPQTSSCSLVRALGQASQTRLLAQLTRLPPVPVMWMPGASVLPPQHTPQSRPQDLGLLKGFGACSGVTHLLGQPVAPPAQLHLQPWGLVAAVSKWANLHATRIISHFFGCDYFLYFL